MTASRSARVLIAEDDQEFRRLLARTLRAEGYEVVETASGVDFLDAFADAVLKDADLDSVCDLIVTDVRMPGFSGLSILDGLRSLGCATPAIIVTAFGDDTTRAAAQSVGALVVDKPFELDELCALIEGRLAAVQDRAN
jgi:DNA-binding response OmpR family regulator